MISAKAEARESDLLERSMDLYRDLSLMLRRTIDGLQVDAESGEFKGQLDLVRSHLKSLQSVLELETGLARRQRQVGGGVELDLDAARAEIRARLALWVAGR